ncbi:MAG: 16S rRNA (adenine1518-N6/adenine1519-N6)-dimethyltransferase [Parcubacteria group bacterium Gr01-1014_33]|nr:MAG: 16S rRNA (adenine1518-N6/adenine1519-N6)-dimethyltransferase [Parcubacteria group bacterium Gr01-1014_33]
MLSPKKSLGQHLLRCEWVISALIHVAEITKKDTILEVGPGTGILTRALAKHAKKVIAVEKDAAFIDTLRAGIPQNTEIIQGDILRLLPNLLSSYNLQPNSYKLVSNIPYYLTSRLLRLLLAGDTKPETIVFTIQKEVAQRITVKPPQMNLLALSVQSFGTPEIIKDIPAACFSPKPKVDSAIIKISRISDKFFTENKIDQKLFFNVVKRAFSQKRKLLSNSLASLAHPHTYPLRRRLSEASPIGVGASTQTIKTLFSSLGFSPNARPEEMSLAQWVRIVKAIAHNGDY